MLRAIKTSFRPVTTRGNAPSAIRLETRLRLHNRLDALILRFGIGREKAVVAPGLYYTGNPDSESPVLVTANYRLTVDALRKELSRVSAWFLVIDTKGVNVWCAAGKGTFSARTVSASVSRTALARLAPSAPLILPQLSASGVNATELSRDTGRRVIFGPVYAHDIPRFLESGLRKDTAMRTVCFTTAERMVLTPVELLHSGPLFLAALLLSPLIALPAGQGYLMRTALTAAYLEGSLLVAIFCFPVFLPILPSRLFSIKGFSLHTIWSIAFFYLTHDYLAELLPFSGPLFLLAGGVASYLTLNFTGSTTFTNQRGVEWEVTRSVPFMICSTAGGLIASAAMVIRNLLLTGGV